MRSIKPSKRRFQPRLYPLSYAAFGQKTIAEGVETEQTLQVLSDLGVDYCSGIPLRVSDARDRVPGKRKELVARAKAARDRAAVALRRANAPIERSAAAEQRIPARGDNETPNQAEPPQ